MGVGGGYGPPPLLACKFEFTNFKNNHISFNKTYNWSKNNLLCNLYLLAVNFGGFG